MMGSRIGDENIGGVWWGQKEVMKIVLIYGAASRSDKNLAGTLWCQEEVMKILVIPGSDEKY